jgi:hypothetical protein
MQKCMLLIPTMNFTTNTWATGVTDLMPIIWQANLLRAG